MTRPPHARRASARRVAARPTPNARRPRVVVRDGRRYDARFLDAYFHMFGVWPHGPRATRADRAAARAAAV